MGVQLCEYARNHWIAHFKSINFMCVNYSSIKLLKKKFAIDKELNLCVFSFLFFSFIFISWRPVTLQYCGGFCRTSTWIGHGCTCVPSSWTPSQLPPHPIPRCPRAPTLGAPLHASNLCWWSISHTVIYIHIYIHISHFIPLLPFPTESKSLFFTSVSLLPSCI